MQNLTDRRQAIALFSAAGAAALLPAWTARAEPVMGDIALGDASAPVTVIEYASFTCPHCAAFHVNTYPKLKEAYIETGKVRFILREVYFDRFGLWASMAARCGGEAGFYPMADQFLKNQKTWASAEPDLIPGEIKKIARLNGLTEEQFNTCLTDQDYAKALIEGYQANAKADDVKSTPTFLINGEKTAGNLPFEEFAKLIDKHL
ncbi:MAG TPA: DsbA family protein [Thermohalobaculum sp.]|nr:DsbA family protein [Thermohalobaculum sp.]